MAVKMSQDTLVLFSDLQIRSVAMSRVVQDQETDNMLSR
jgi:hypothetical protein